APGSFPLQGRETVLDGIVAAGGLNIRASRDNIILSRPTAPDGCRVVLPVCYRQVVQLGDTTTNYQLQPADRIYVPSQTLREQIFGRDMEMKGCARCKRLQFPCSGGCGGPDLPHPADPTLMAPPTSLPAAATPGPNLQGPGMAAR